MIEKPSKSKRFTWTHGAVTRGPRDRKRISLIFTGGDYGEGTGKVLETLSERRIPGSFFFTGDYLRDFANTEFISEAIRKGHYLGPHSDKHLLYCPWEDREKTLVTKEEFLTDLEANVKLLENLGVNRSGIRWWIPPYEWYNATIAQWASDAGLPLFNFTPGTLSHADYTPDNAKNFRDNETILKSVFEFEEREPDGLNGFLLLTHVGAGAGRTVKFFNVLGDFIDRLAGLGYSFCRLDEMLEGALEEREWAAGDQ